jgi:hypothetical protein
MFMRPKLKLKAAFVYLGAAMWDVRVLTYSQAVRAFNAAKSLRPVERHRGPRSVILARQR